jgi:AAA family ATP:ADP antiporter
MRARRRRARSGRDTDGETLTLRSRGIGVAPTSMVSSATRRHALIDRLLRLFSNVRPGEGALAALMLLCVLLILTAYYVMKTAREGLILAGGTFGLGGDELKIYASGAMALLLVGVVPAYDRLASRVRRIRLINVSYAIVMMCLLVFYVLGRAGVNIGLPFFIWLGLVNVFLVAQFWSYANDIYTEEQGKRLFAIIAIGGSLGAIIGPRIASLAETFNLMVIAVVLLVACLALFNTIERLHDSKRDALADQPIASEGGFKLVLHDRYLLMIAALLIITNLVNTTGEFVLSNAVRNHALDILPGDAAEPQRREMIKAFYGDFFMWVNLTSFVIQAFLVSRIIATLGVRAALFVLPIIAFGAYAAIGIFGGLALIRIAKIAENATDYSLQNTVRQTLFLPTERAAKYKAKAAIDTFFMRAGDTLSALFVAIGIHRLGFGGRHLAFMNVLFVGVWIAVAVGIARQHLRMRGEEPRPARRFKAAPAGAHA